MGLTLPHAICIRDQLIIILAILILLVIAALSVYMVNRLIIFRYRLIID